MKILKFDIFSPHHAEMFDIIFLTPNSQTSPAMPQNQWHISWPPKLGKWTPATCYQLNETLLLENHLVLKLEFKCFFCEFVCCAFWDRWLMYCKHSQNSHSHHLMGIDSVLLTLLVELQVTCVGCICFWMGASRLDPQNVREIDKIIYISILSRLHAFCWSNVSSRV